MTVSSNQATTDAGDVQARLMLVVLCLIWGVTWPMMKIALNEMPPLTMRTITIGIGAVVLFAICLVLRRSLYMAFGLAWLHVFIATLLNIVGFNMFSAYAQIAASTSRVTILTYAMPIWAMLFSWLVMRERPSRLQAAALALCALGLAILIRPLATGGIPLGLAFAIAGGASWAAGTVYIKWARLDVNPIGFAAWQLFIGFLIIVACAFMFDGRLQTGAIRADGLAAAAFTGAFGNGIAYALWFAVVRRVSAVTATLGMLGIPIIGVIATVLMLGERPTATDLVGFVLIFIASACVLLGPVIKFGCARPATG